MSPMMVLALSGRRGLAILRVVITKNSWSTWMLVLPAFPLHNLSINAAALRFFGPADLS